MKRLHIHLHVTDLQASIAFYERLFAAAPTRLENDYAKWMLDDPSLNFAISTRGQTPGLNHLGIQVDTPEELATMKAAAQSADMRLVDEGETTCCYARSDKHWITDPQGIAWEHFHTLDDIAVFSETTASTPGVACCAPSTPASSCCTPTRQTHTACCGDTPSSSSCC